MFLKMRGVLILCLVAGLVCCGMLLVNKRKLDFYAQEQARVAALWPASPQWQKQAKAFNKHKAAVSAIFEGADRVEAFSLIANGSAKSLGKVHDLPYYAQGREQGRAFADRLGKIILSPQSYPLPGVSAKQCYIEPGVVYRVWKQREYVDVVLCFECNVLVVFEYNNSAPKDTVGGWLEGRFNIEGDFDSVRPQLVALTREAFPDDATLSRL